MYTLYICILGETTTTPIGFPHCKQSEKQKKWRENVRKKTKQYVKMHKKIQHGKVKVKYLVLEKGGSVLSSLLFLGKRENQTKPNKNRNNTATTPTIHQRNTSKDESHQHGTVASFIETRSQVILSIKRERRRESYDTAGSSSSSSRGFFLSIFMLPAQELLLIIIVTFLTLAPPAPSRPVLTPLKESSAVPAACGPTCRRVHGKPKGCGARSTQHTHDTHQIRSYACTYIIQSTNT